jgi:hypothetical protein
VSFDSMIQSLKADPRVGAASSGLDITDESFAQAAVKLADAFARGDADKLKEMMTNRAKGVVDSLVADGSWAETAPRIEAVRIVYAGSPGSVGDLERQQGLAQMKAMWPAQIRAFEDRLIKRGFDKNEMERFKAQFQLDLEQAFVAAQFDQSAGNIKAASDGSADPAPSDSAEMALLLAVQTPDGADLLGWTGRKAGDSWIFNNASTLGLPRAKASDWDNVGMFGFSLGTGKAPVAPKATKREEPKPAEGGGNATSTPSPAPEPGPGSPPPIERPNRDPRRLVPR